MLTHNTLACCVEGCYAVITLHPDEEARLRRTHEGFYCPGGHRQHFFGKTAQEKRIAELEAEIADWRSEASDLYDERDSERERLREIAKAMQTCPLGCGWQGNRRLGVYGYYSHTAFLDRVGGDLVAHLEETHGVKAYPSEAFKNLERVPTNRT